MQFIYVFSEKDKQVLEKLGYQLMKENGKVYVFLNNEQQNYERLPVQAVFSSTLTF